MVLRPVKSVSLSALTFFFLILMAAMGWVITLNQLHGHDEGISRQLIEIGEEILKLVVIAAAAAIAVEKFLLKTPEEDMHNELRKAGIRQIFLKREEAGAEFLRCVQDDNVRMVTICGISLRDLLRGGGALYQVWRAICERM